MKRLIIILSLIGIGIFIVYSIFWNKRSSIKETSIVNLINNEAEHRIDVLIDSQRFVSYCWVDSLMKPILYPVFSSSGAEITRGFPIKTRPGERTDHPHQVGIWLNYGDVNGIDFWGNSYEIPDEIRKVKCGQIRHLQIEKLTSGPEEASMTTIESWVAPSGKELLREHTTYHFIARGATRIIDRITTLTANDDSIRMGDTKEGMFGIRVARGLELPSQEEVTLADTRGNLTTVKKMSNEGVTGNYKSSEGISGDSVWGTRAKWMELYGNLGDEKVSVVIFDHPHNINYPTYWHARGYGLFCLNPFGVKDFTNGKEVLNYTIPPRQSITLRYRVMIHSGDYFTDAELDSYSQDFDKRYENAP